MVTKCRNGKSRMKLLTAVALLAGLSQALVACGKNDPQSNNTNVPAPGFYQGLNTPAGGYVPTGNYWGYNGWSQCPTGYVLSGGTCVLNTNGGNVTCGANMTWNGYACVPTNFNCPNGGQFSYLYGGCVTTQCDPYNILWGAGTFYVCKYTYGAPQPNCWFNGYGWQCR